MDMILTIIASILMLVGFFVICRSSDDEEDEEEESDESWPMSDKKKKFRKLSESSTLCRLCPAMSDLPAVLSSKNGSIYTDLIFIAEAPGRVGSGRTGLPFHGDRAGNNF